MNHAMVRYIIGKLIVDASIFKILECNIKTVVGLYFTNFPVLL